MAQSRKNDSSALLRDATKFNQIFKQVESLEAKVDKYRRLNQLKSKFVGTVSHELRTPLATIKEFASIISDEIPGKLTEEQREYIDIIKNNIDRLTRLINDLLDISKIEAGRIELRKTLVDFSAVIKGVVSSFRMKADRKKIRFKTYFDSKVPNLYIDSDRVNQVLTNLLSNAIKFTPKEGEITVKLKDRGGEVTASVADTGVGIASENLSRVFEQFRQFGRLPEAGTRGTGLGLAITKELVQMHSGKIWVESEIGKGSKFIFTLPKLSSEDIFKEYISRGIIEVRDRGTKLSIIVISVANFQKLLESLGKAGVIQLLGDLEGISRKALRRATDVIVKDTGAGEVVILLADTKKKDAFRLQGRLEDTIRKYIRKKKKSSEKVQINFGLATFPDEAKNEEEILNRARSQYSLLYTDSERRRFRREKIELKVGISSEGKYREAKLDYTVSKDLSGMGVGLFTKDKLKVDSKLFILVEVPSRGVPLKLKGKVTWSRRADKGDRFPYRAGIKFQGIKPDSRILFQRMIKS